LRYQQPFGITDANAGYINGNPQTGTMGSIPPAAGIEHPQREIVNFLSLAMTPNENDLYQLAKSVQGGFVNYALDTGTPNFVAVSPVLPIATLAAGLSLRIKLSNTNTGPTKVNVSNLGWQPLKHGDGTEMGSGELSAGNIITIIWDAVASRWQTLSGGSTSGSVISLTAPQSFYVNAATGDDANYDGSAAAVDSAHGHGPFRSLRKALAQMTKYNLSGFSFNIYLADGVYSEGTILQFPTPNGSGAVNIIGNVGSPQNVKLVNAGAGTCIQIGAGYYFLDGVSFASTAPTTGDGGHGFWVLSIGSARLGTVAFWQCAGVQLLAGPGGNIAVQGPVTILGGTGGDAHCVATGNGIIAFTQNPKPTLNITGSAVFSGAFARADGGGQCGCGYAAINYTGGATVTGPRYVASANGVINTGGQSTTYLPGSAAGALATGGQYV
jgi:hypothetical protein